MCASRIDGGGNTANLARKRAACTRPLNKALSFQAVCGLSWPCLQPVRSNLLLMCIRPTTGMAQCSASLCEHGNMTRRLGLPCSQRPVLTDLLRPHELVQFCGVQPFGQCAGINGCGWHPQTVGHTHGELKKNRWPSAQGITVLSTQNLALAGNLLGWRAKTFVLQAKIFQFPTRVPVLNGC